MADDKTLADVVREMFIEVGMLRRARAALEPKP